MGHSHIVGSIVALCSTCKPLCSTCKMIEASRIGCAADIQVTNVVEGDGSLVVNGVSSGSKQCPDCGELSNRRKGGYQDWPDSWTPSRDTLGSAGLRCF